MRWRAAAGGLPRHSARTGGGQGQADHARNPERRGKRFPRGQPATWAPMGELGRRCLWAGAGEAEPPSKECWGSGGCGRGKEASWSTTGPAER